MNRSLIFAAFAAVGLLSVGCGSSSPPATTTTPAPVVTATPTDVPTATPTPDYRVTAAAAYLAAADTVNSGFDALNKAYPGTTFTSISQAKRYWSQAETLDRAFLTASRTIQSLQPTQPIKPPKLPTPPIVRPRQAQPMSSGTT